MKEKINKLIELYKDIVKRDNNFIEKYEGTFGSDDITINVLKGQNIALENVIDNLKEIIE